MSNPYYIFDTNIISVLFQMSNLGLFKRIRSYNRETLILCELVIYEIERGLKHRNAHNMLARFHSDFVPLFQMMAVRDRRLEIGRIFVGKCPQSRETIE